MSTPNKSLSFGRYLMAKRLEKGIGLKDISAKTRIGEDMIALIEKEDHAQLPAPVFVKGFLRLYANAIGVDGERAVRLYLGDLNVIAAATRFEPDKSRSRDLFWPRTLGPLALLLCIMIVSVYGDYLLSRPKTDHVQRLQPPTDQIETDRIETDRSPAVATAEPVAEKAESAASEANAETALDRRPEVPDAVNKDHDRVDETPDSLQTESREKEKPAKKMLLKIVAVDTTWMRVIVDDHDPKEVTLKAEEQLKLEGKSGFSLHIGNAAGIRLFLDDKPLAVPGKKGQVVKIRIP